MMSSLPRRILLTCVVVLWGAVGCARRAADPAPAPAPSGGVPIQPGTGVVTPGPAAAAIAAMRPKYTRADVDFMQGMIPHHAQAIVMSRMAPTHGARSDVRILAERIIVSQRDEIALMRRWLADNNEYVPDSNATHHRHTMGGATHEMLMPGMLSAEEIAQLDRARGAEFDRLFLTFMIRHHEGAVEMVRTLFASPGAGQDETVFRFASDVEADQMAEITRMQQMLRRAP